MAREDDGRAPGGTGAAPGGIAPAGIASVGRDEPGGGLRSLIGPTAGLVLLAGLLALRALDADPLVRLRLLGFDILQSALPAAPLRTDHPVSVLAIDEASLDTLGQWPWPRDLMAELVRSLDGAGARLIAFDVVFAEPDRMRPDALVARFDLPAAESEALRTLAVDPDAVFAEAMARSAAPIVLANALQAVTTGPPTVAGVVLPPTLALAAAAELPRELPLAGRVVGNVPELEEAADDRGFLTIVSDGDGVVRRLPLLAHAGSGLQTGLTLTVARMALDADVVVIRSHPQFGILGVTIGGRAIATDSSGSLWLPGRPTGVDRVAAAELLAGRADPALIAGRIVLIGSTALGLGDLHTTASGAARPGVEILADGIRVLLDGEPPSRPGYASWLELFAALLIGLVFIYRMSRHGAVRTALWGGAIALAIVAACAAALAFTGTLIDATFPSLATALVAGTAGYVRSREIERGRLLSARRLAEADRLINRLVEATFDAIVAVDRRGRLLFTNRAARALPIFAGGLAAGADLKPLLRSADRGDGADRRSLFEELAAHPGIVDLVTAGTDGGASLYLEVTTTVLEDDGAVVLVMRDVTARRTARRRIEAQAAELRQMSADLQRRSEEAHAARAAADRATAAKAEFLMMMSHELRTPLNAVIGFADLMGNEPFGPLGDPRYSSYLQDIRTAGSQLLSMIDSILEVIRLDSLDPVPHDGDYSIATIVAECCATMRPEAEVKSIRLDYAVGPEVPHFLGDPRLMRQVVMPLLSNAIKFTEAGGRVVVSIQRAREGGLALTVADDGLGMSPGELDRAVKLLEQGNGSVVRRHGGLGVGLALARLATEKQGGRIRIDSAVGRGTTIKVWFPETRLGTPEGAAAGTEPPAPLNQGGATAG